MTYKDMAEMKKIMGGSDLHLLLGGKWLEKKIDKFYEKHPEEKEALKNKVQARPEQEHMPSFGTDLSVEPTVEKAEAILESYVPRGIPKKILGFTRYMPDDKEYYKNTLGRMMETETWGCDTGKKVIHQALDNMKKKAAGDYKAAVNKLKRDFEKNEKFYRGRNLARGALFLAGSVVAEETGGALGMWPSISSILP